MDVTTMESLGDPEVPEAGFITCLTFSKQGAMPSGTKRTRNNAKPAPRKSKLLESLRNLELTPETEGSADELLEILTSLELTPETEGSAEDLGEEGIENLKLDPDDRIIVTGHVIDDYGLLQVHVVDLEKQEVIWLKAKRMPELFPLAVEWLDFKQSQYAAVGTNAPEIDIYDLNTLEPTMTLGAPPVLKTAKHAGPVMDLSWSPNARNLLASGSCDKTVIVWDMNRQALAHRFNLFDDQVLSVEFHPWTPTSLLTGDANGRAVLVDFGSYLEYKVWEFGRDVERVLWNKFNPIYFFVSSSEGNLHCVDVRMGRPFWGIKAHAVSAAGIELSGSCGDFLITTGKEEAKLWDLKGSIPKLVMEQDLGVGRIWGVSASPDCPSLFAVGGSNLGNPLSLWDTDKVVSGFRDCGKEEVDDEAMEVTSSLSAFTFQEKQGMKASAAKPSLSNGNEPQAGCSVKDTSKKVSALKPSNEPQPGCSFWGTSTKASAPKSSNEPQPGSSFWDTSKKPEPSPSNGNEPDDEECSIIYVGEKKKNEPPAQP